MTEAYKIYDAVEQKYIEIGACVWKSKAGAAAAFFHKSSYLIDKDFMINWKGVVEKRTMKDQTRYELHEFEFARKVNND